MTTFARRIWCWEASVVWPRLAVALWLAIVAGSCLRCVVGKADRDVGMFAVYAEAGRHWVAGADLYPPRDSWDSFLYSPLIAAALVPYAMLPTMLGNVLWRLTVCGAFIFTLRWWCRSLGLADDPSRLRTALLFLLVLPMTAMTMLDGQAGGLVAAAILGTMAAAAERRWYLVAGFAAVGILLKIYPIALLLLLCVVLPRRLAGPALCILLLGLAFPFCLQRPTYVAEQYGKWLAMLGASDRLGWDINIANRDLALLFRVAGMPLPKPIWTALQLGAGCVAAGICLLAIRAGWPTRRLLLMVQTLAVCWMTLFGPVVESFTYILIGPTLALMLLDAWRRHVTWPYRFALVSSWCIFTSATLAVIFMRSIVYHRMGPHPVAGLLLLACVLADVVMKNRTSQHDEFDHARANLAA